MPLNKGKTMDLFTGTCELLGSTKQSVIKKQKSPKKRISGHAYSTKKSQHKNAVTQTNTIELSSKDVESPNDISKGKNDNKLSLNTTSPKNNENTDKVSSSPRTKKKRTKWNSGSSASENSSPSQISSQSRKKRIRLARKNKIKNSSKSEEEPKLNNFRKAKRFKNAPPYSVTGNWYIASGFLNDISNLLSMFEKQPGSRFKDFSYCWQKLAFSLVYRGRQHLKELLEFSEEIMLLTQRYLAPPHNLKKRIGALYAVYGLYYKYPYRNHFKVRLTMTAYQHLFALVEPYYHNIENPDPAFIFTKLKLDGAFYYIVMPMELCVEFHNPERDLVDNEYRKQQLLQLSSLTSALPKSEIEETTKLLNYYHDLKCASSGKDKPEKSLDLLNKNLMDVVEEDLKQLREQIMKEVNITKANDLGFVCEIPSAKDVEVRQDNFDEMCSSEIEFVSSKSSTVALQDKHKVDANTENHSISTSKYPELNKDLNCDMLTYNKESASPSKEYHTKRKYRLPRKQAILHAKFFADIHNRPKELSLEATKSCIKTPKKRTQSKISVEEIVELSPDKLTITVREPSICTEYLNADDLKSDLFDAEQDSSQGTISSENGVSSDLCIDISECNILKKAKNKKLLKKFNLSEPLKFVVKLRSPKGIIEKKIKIKIIPEQWFQIQKNENRLNELKKKLIPLLLPNIKSESLWSVEDLRLANENDSINLESMDVEEVQSFMPQDISISKSNSVQKTSPKFSHESKNVISKSPTKKQSRKKRSNITTSDAVAITSKICRYSLRERKPSLKTPRLQQYVSSLKEKNERKTRSLCNDHINLDNSVIHEANTTDCFSHSEEEVTPPSMTTLDKKDNTVMKTLYEDWMEDEVGEYCDVNEDHYTFFNNNSSIEPLKLESVEYDNSLNINEVYDISSTASYNTDSKISIVSLLPCEPNDHVPANAPVYSAIHQPVLSAMHLQNNQPYRKSLQGQIIVSPQALAGAIQTYALTSDSRAIPVNCIPNYVTFQDSSSNIIVPVSDSPLQVTPLPHSEELTGDSNFLSGNTTLQKRLMSISLNKVSNSNNVSNVKDQFKQRVPFFWVGKQKPKSLLPSQRCNFMFPRKLKPSLDTS